jgi:hypothetical protein
MYHGGSMRRLGLVMVLWIPLAAACGGKKAAPKAPAAQPVEPANVERKAEPDPGDPTSAAPAVPPPAPSKLNGDPCSGGEKK